MAEPILTTKDLKKQYGAFEAVKGISFNVLRGEIFSLLGPNGAGKTTTISMLSCLLNPTSGEAEVNGQKIPKEAMAVKKIIGVVPQEIALYDTLTAKQNLVFWGQMYDMGGKTLDNRITEVLELIGLTDRADSRVETFSGGMKRRLNIGVGLMHKPQLLFMDEPTVGIDPQSRRRIMDTVKDLKNQGMTVLYTTHYMEEAEELSDRVGIIDHGKLIALGTQKELTRLVGEQETLRLHLGDGLGEAGDSSEKTAEMLQTLPQVILGRAVNGEVVLTVEEAAEALPAVVSWANGANIRIRSIDIEGPNLEAVFLHLTGRALRD